MMTQIATAWILAWAPLWGASGDPVKDGLAAYAAGNFADAVTSFRSALADDPENPRLRYNLALALWRAGDGDGAEVAAEKAAADGGGVFEGLRDSILGHVRYDRARKMADGKIEPAKEVEVLTKAVEMIGRSRDYLQRGAMALSQNRSASAPEVIRNLERAIKLEEDLRKRLEDAKKRQQEQQKKDDENKKDDKKDENKKDDKKTEDPSKDKKDKNEDEKDESEQKDDEKKQDKKSEDPENKDKKEKEPEDQQKKDQQKKDQKDPGEPPPEPDPKKENKEDKDKSDPAPKPGDEEPNKPQDPPKPMPAPGEHDPNKELTPEQRRALLKRLAESDASLLKLKQARKAARPRVKKDW